MSSEMRWAISKTPKFCKMCDKVIHPGAPYLNVPKSYRGLAGNYCEKCEHKRLIWGGHIVELEDKKKKHPKATPGYVKHAENYFRERNSQ